jgi:hypothetical protein
MTEALLVASGVSALNNSTSPKTASINLLGGDMLVVARVQESAGGVLNTTAPTGVTGATWSSRRNEGTSSQHCRVNIHTAEGFSAGAYTLSCVRPGNQSGNQWGFGWAVLRNHGGVGNTAGEALAVNESQPALDLLTTAADSCIFYALGDWNAVTGTQTGRTISGSSLTVVGNLAGNGSNYGTWMGLYVGVGAVGTKTVGLTAPTGQRPTHAAIEILGVAGGGSPEVEGWGVQAA